MTQVILGRVGCGKSACPDPWLVEPVGSNYVALDRHRGGIHAKDVISFEHRCRYKSLLSNCRSGSGQLAFYEGCRNGGFICTAGPICRAPHSAWDHQVLSRSRYWPLSLPQIRLVGSNSASVRPSSHSRTNPLMAGATMPKSWREELSEKADEERRRCRDWLLPFMQNNQPKLLTKAELRDAAMAEPKVSENSFDFAWIDAIERAGRDDWYEPLRRRFRVKS